MKKTKQFLLSPYKKSEVIFQAVPGFKRSNKEDRVECRLFIIRVQFHLSADKCVGFTLEPYQMDYERKLF